MLSIICLHFSDSSVVLLSAPVALSVLCHSCWWPILLTFFFSPKSSILYIYVCLFFIKGYAFFFFFNWSLVGGMYKIRCCHIALVVAVYTFIYIYLFWFVFVSVHSFFFFSPGNTSGIGKFDIIVNDTTTALTVYCIICCLFCLFVCLQGQYWRDWRTNVYMFCCVF